MSDSVPVSVKRLLPERGNASAGPYITVGGFGHFTEAAPTVTINWLACRVRAASLLMYGRSLWDQTPIGGVHTSRQCSDAATVVQVAANRAACPGECAEQGKYARSIRKAPQLTLRTAEQEYLGVAQIRHA